MQRKKDAHKLPKMLYSMSTIVSLIECKHSGQTMANQDCQFFDLLSSQGLFHFQIAVISPKLTSNPSLKNPEFSEASIVILALRHA